MFKGMAGQGQGQMPSSKHSAMKERLRRKMEEKKLREASVQAQAPVQSFVVKIGDEKQEKSAPLSEAELIKLFNKKSKK
jgi:hypothetical protein